MAHDKFWARQLLGLSVAPIIGAGLGAASGATVTPGNRGEGALLGALTGFVTAPLGAYAFTKIPRLAGENLWSTNVNRKGLILRLAAGLLGLVGPTAGAALVARSLADKPKEPDGL